MLQLRQSMRARTMHAKLDTCERCALLGSRWTPHLQLNAVNDGDIIFMHQQSRNNRAAGPNPNFATHYFTPGDSDRWRPGL